MLDTVSNPNQPGGGGGGGGTGSVANQPQVGVSLRQQQHNQQAEQALRMREGAVTSDSEGGGGGGEKGGVTSNGSGGEEGGEKQQTGKMMAVRVQMLDDSITLFQVQVKNPPYLRYYLDLINIYGKTMDRWLHDLIACLCSTVYSERRSKWV